MADYFGGLVAGGPGMDPAAALAQRSSYDPWQIMAMVEQSPAMQASFGMPMPPNMGPQQPQAQQPNFGQLLAMMGPQMRGQAPGLFQPGSPDGRPPGVQLGGGGGRAMQAPGYQTGAPTRNVPSLGQLLGRR